MTNGNMSLQLVCGNRNYSSWSLRAWLCLRKAGLEADVLVLPMDTPEFHERIGTYSPTGRVPVLRMGDEVIWDSLAIAETVNERFAQGRLWPEAAALRAHGRCMAAEMHSGFAALRNALPMNCRAVGRRLAIEPAVAKDVQRVAELWQEARRRAGTSDGWLLGEFSIADAMFAPVALRFRAYALDLPEAALAYRDFWLQDAHLQEWIELACQEDWVIEHEEAGEEP